MSLRRAQLELEAVRDRFSLLYDSVPIGYVTLDEEGTVLEANLTAAGMLGARRETMGQKIRPFRRPGVPRHLPPAPAEGAERDGDRNLPVANAERGRRAIFRGGGERHHPQ